MDRNQFLINYRQSVGDITGWQSLIFIPFYIFWLFLMLLIAIYSWLRAFFYMAYDMRNDVLIYTGYITDFIYLLDVFTAFLHTVMVKTRKLRKYKPRKWYWFVVDIISLLPIEIASDYLYSDNEEEQKKVRAVHGYLYFNKILRIYRAYIYFAEVKPLIKKWYISVFVSYFEIALYHFLASYMYGCIWVVLGSEEEKKNCKKDPFWCILRDQTVMWRLSTHQHNGNYDVINSYGRRIVVVISLLTGYVLIYGFAIPVLIFTCIKILRPFFEISNRLTRLRKFVGNMINSKDLREKTVRHFRAVWTYGRGEEEPEIMKKLPLALRKDISADIHWEAFKHSALFRSVSLGFKRSLALTMRTDFVVPNTTLYDLGDKKKQMMYLASGVLQIMSEENSKSPVLSFSAGTIIGEIGMFLIIKNKAIIRSATFSQIGVLKAVDLFRVLNHYPKDKLIIFRRLKRRFEISKLMRLRKQPIFQDLKVLNEEMSAGLGEDEDHIKWIKRQCRALASLHIRDGVIFRSKREGVSIELPKTNIDHTSKYLEMLSLSDAVEVKTDVVCLKTSLPWVMDPDSQFLIFWRRWILLITFFTATSYPYFIGWYEFFPEWFLDVTFLVTLIFIIDVLIQMSIAVKTRDTVIIDFIDRLIDRLQNVTFYLDVIAALPVHIIYHLAVPVDEKKPYHLNIYASFALLKAYRIYLFFQELAQKIKLSIVTITMIKYLFFLSFLTYCIAVVYEITGVNCVFKECHPQDWYGLVPEKNEKKIAAVYYAISTGTMTPARDFTTTTPFSMILTLSLSAFFLFFITLWHGEYIAAYVLDKSNELNFKGLIENVMHFLRERGISSRISKRVLAMMKFQWYYDYGDYFTQERSMLDDAPPQLQLEIDRDTVLKSFKKCDFVSSESEEFIRDLSLKGTRVAFPANSVICTFGNQTMQLFLVHKGFCQMNSFLPDDIINGFGSSVISGPGRIFPVIVAMNQIPSAVTVWTLTDCELVVIELEDLLETLIQHDAFKDTVEAIKITDFSSILDARIALTQKIEYRLTNEDYKRHFAKYKCIGRFLSILLLKRAINNETATYGKWELSRVIFLSISIITWPIVHGLFMYPEKVYIIHMLFILDIIAWIDIYIRMNVSYRNRKGIKVTHTLKTLTHYLKSSFLTDLVASPPFHHIYRFVHYGFSDMSSILKTSPTLVVIHLLMRLVGIYRIYGYVTLREGFSRSAQRYKFVKYLFFLFIILNMFVNVWMLYDVAWIYETDTNKYRFELLPNSWMQFSPIENLTEPCDVYLIVLYATMILTFRNDFYFMTWNANTVIVEISMGIVGWVVVKLIFALFTSNFTSANLNFTIYQDRMTCFLDFLYSEKADDTIISEAVEHFEYEWVKMKGENLQKIFSRFPNVLQEDLSFPLYISTIRAVDCLSRANSAFYRQLSRHLTEAHFRKGSLIIFEKQVQNYIYFLHAGRCFVYGNSVLLLKGSMFGDIRKKGVMQNNIYAMTHIHCLVIPSDSFYLIVNNFFETEYAFMEAAKNVDDYIESRLKNLKDEKYGDTTFKPRGSVDYEESYFEVIDAERASLTRQDISLTKQTARKLRTIVHPTSWIKSVYKILLSINAYVTVSLLLIFVAVESLPLSALVLFYVLDLMWLVKIILTLRTGYYDEKTGDLITSSKMITRRYLSKLDGLITDILAVMPFEVIPVIVGYSSGSPVNWRAALYCALFRLLRFIFLIRFISLQSRKLSMKCFYRWFIIFGIQFFVINIMVATYIYIATHPLIDVSEIQWEWDQRHSEALLWGYLHVANLFTGAGLHIFRPAKHVHIVYVIFVCLVAVCSKALFINQVSAVINVVFHSKSEYLHKLQLLENYLHLRNISPYLLESTREYCSELLKSYRTSAMPQFLMESPPFLKVAIMQDLYLAHLSDCYVFQDLSLDFLKQLTARLERHIYFPGDKIVEKGDVDLNIYFVHRGEVSCMDYDEEFPALEYPVDVYQADEYFGLLQGLYRAMPHSNTYRARTVADILILNHSNWSDIRLAFPELTEMIYARAIASRSAKKTFIDF